MNRSAPAAEVIVAAGAAASGASGASRRCCDPIPDCVDRVRRDRPDDVHALNAGRGEGAHWRSSGRGTDCVFHQGLVAGGTCAAVTWGQLCRGHVRRGRQLAHDQVGTDFHETPFRLADRIACHRRRCAGGDRHPAGVRRLRCSRRLGCSSCPADRDEGPADHRQRECELRNFVWRLGQHAPARRRPLRHGDHKQQHAGQRGAARAFLDGRERHPGRQLSRRRRDALRPDGPERRSVGEAADLRASVLRAPGDRLRRPEQRLRAHCAQPGWAAPRCPSEPR